MSTNRAGFDPEIYGDKLPQAVVAPINAGTPGIVCVTGKVVSAYPNKPWKVVTKSGREFYLKYHAFCPVRTGDIISAICTDLIGDNLNVIQHPTVLAPEDEDSVIKTLMIMLKKSGVGYRQCVKLYEILDSDPNRSATEHLSHISHIWHKLKSDDHLYPITKVLEVEVAIKLVCLWRKSADKRSLYLLGFTRRDIESFEDPLHEVHRAVMENPYTVPQVTLEMCNKVDTITGRTPKELDLYCGKVIRDIYGRMISKAWSAVTYYWLDRRYQDLHRFIDVLTSDYGCVFTVINSHDENGGAPKPVKVVYLKYVYDMEVYVSDFIIQRSKPADSEDFRSGIVAGPIIQLPDQPTHETELDEVQIGAVTRATQGGIMCLTGGPGTGKTTTIKEIVKILEHNNISYAMTSFVGKAVSRIKSVVKAGVPPATMHRMIYSPERYRGFKVLICDESSMVATSLFYQFLMVFGTNFSLILVGDNQQLPTITYGSFYNQVLKSRCVPKVVLKHIYRVVDLDPGAKDAIVTNLERIAAWPDNKYYAFVPGNNLFFLDGDERKILDVVKLFHQSGITQDRWKIVCPYRKDLDLLNSISQAIYHGHEKSVTVTGDKTYHKGDQVICLRNNYDADVMNGEEGVVVDVGVDYVEVLFDGENLVKVPAAKANDSFFAEDDESAIMDTNSISLAYALTIHKVQGSEFEYVVFLMPSCAKSTHTNFLNRNLVYTGLSRARKYIYHLGNSTVTSNCISHVLPYRCEYMSDRIRDHLPIIYPMENKVELCTTSPPEEGELPPDDFWDDDYY